MDILTQNNKRALALSLETSQMKIIINSQIITRIFYNKVQIQHQQHKLP